MARREVVEVTCDRCSKTETQNKDEAASDKPEFTLYFGLHELIYQDLCRGCRRALENYIKKITMEEPDGKKHTAKKEVLADTPTTSPGFLGMGKKHS